jgi:enamine deaminase RidA (YjgF/YER057c/UK114 family)
MAKKTVFPAGHWSLQVDIPYSMGLACGDLIFLCGQADLEGDGKVCNANDLLTQSSRAIKHIGIPFRCLAYEGMMIEIEAIAMSDAD